MEQEEEFGGVGLVGWSWWCAGLSVGVRVVGLLGVVWLCLEWWVLGWMGLGVGCGGAHGCGVAGNGEAFRVCLERGEVGGLCLGLTFSNNETDGSGDHDDGQRIGFSRGGE